MKLNLLILTVVIAITGCVARQLHTGNTLTEESALQKRIDALSPKMTRDETRRSLGLPPRELTGEGCNHSWTEEDQLPSGKFIEVNYVGHLVPTNGTWIQQYWFDTAHIKEQR